MDTTNSTDNKSNLNNNTTVNGINANTPIIFTAKSFAILMGMMVGIFFTFYQVFIVPKFNKIDNNYIELTKYQREQTEKMNNKFNTINTSISAINSSINSINLRFSDLNHLSTITNETNGSLSSNTVKLYEFDSNIDFNNSSNNQLSLYSKKSALSNLCIIE